MQEIKNGILKKYNAKPKKPTAIILDGAVKKIGNCAFMGCKNLDYIDETAKRKQIYEFMLNAADHFIKDPDIWGMVFSYGDYSMKFVADKTRRRIFSIYGCDEDGNVLSEQPLCTGNAEEIVRYLNNKANIDSVVLQVWSE